MSTRVLWPPSVLHVLCSGTRTSMSTHHSCAVQVPRVELLEAGPRMDLTPR